MRNSFRILAASAMALAGVALAAVPSGAGGSPTNTVTVEKHVVGSVPTGTTFTVEVTCESILGAGAAAPTPVSAQFATACAGQNPAADGVCAACQRKNVSSSPGSPACVVSTASRAPR